MTTIAERRPLAQPPAKDVRAARRARARLVDRFVTGSLWVLAGGVIALLAYFILYTIVKGLHVLSWNFVTKADVLGQYVGPEVFNTFYILIFALLLCIPVGIGGAVYLTEYARQGTFTRTVRLAVETLAGVPSLVLGFFGYLVLVTSFGYGHRLGYSRLAGAITLAILNLPLIVQVSEDALRAVSRELKEASVALGATRSQTIFRVLIPTSLPRFTTGVILTAGKMIGETAALIFTAGISGSVTGWFSLDPRIAGDTLTVHLYTLQAEGITPNAKAIAAGTATLLVLILLFFNVGLRSLSGLLNRRISGKV